MATLLQVRTSTRENIDEAVAKRWTDATLNEHIKDQIEDIANELVARSFVPLQSVSDVTASNGVLDLSSLSPAKIVDVSLVCSSTTLKRVPPARARDAATFATTNETFRITYFAKPTLPSVDGDSVTYGNTTFSNRAVDRYVAIAAARAALAKDNEVREGLELLYKEAKENVLKIADGPGWYVMPMARGNRDSFYAYLERPTNDLQILYRY